MLRKDNTRITKRALVWNPQGTRKRGRPLGKWRGMKDKDLERKGKSWNYRGWLIVEMGGRCLCVVIKAMMMKEYGIL